MIYTAIDAETTGFSKVYDSPVSLAYLSFNEKWEVLDSGILYFDDDSICNSTPQAFAVHGLTRDFLSKFRGDFERNNRKLFKLIERGNLIGHNIQSFDVPFLSAYLRRQGFSEETQSESKNNVPDRPIPLRIIDTRSIYRPIFHKGLTLDDLLEKAGIPDIIIRNVLRKHFGDEAVNSGHHDARYDTVAAYLLFQYAVEKGYATL